MTEPLVKVHFDLDEPPPAMIDAQFWIVPKSWATRVT